MTKPPRTSSQHGFAPASPPRTSSSQHGFAPASPPRGLSFSDDKFTSPCPRRSSASLCNRDHKSPPAEAAKKKTQKKRGQSDRSNPSPPPATPAPTVTSRPAPIEPVRKGDAVTGVLYFWKKEKELTSADIAQKEAIDRLDEWPTLETARLIVLSRR